MTNTRVLYCASALAVMLPIAATNLEARGDQRGNQNYPRGPQQPRGGYETQRPQQPRGGYGAERHDFAIDNGFSDGYKEGFDAGHDGDRADSVREKRYRSGDSGYERWYGPRELYKDRYRNGFRLGYERGYQDGRDDRRYGRDRRYDRYDRNSKPWWWPW